MIPEGVTNRVFHPNALRACANCPYGDSSRRYHAGALMDARPETDVALRACWSALLAESTAFCERVAPLYAANDWKLYG